MKKWLVGSWLALVMAHASAAEIQFGAYDVWIDSNDTPLAAYQVEIWASAGVVKIAGIEGGDAEAFRTPPFYDPRAIQSERVILGGVRASAKDLKAGDQRVARLHVQHRGEVMPLFEAKIQVLSASGGKKIAGKIRVERRKTHENESEE